MKYKSLNQTIPKEKRNEINEKILYLIDNNLAEKNSVSREIIYNAYTGIGGLHNLDMNDYNNFYEYSNHKKDIENGQFFTKHEDVKYLSDILQIEDSAKILDLTSGSGNMFNFSPKEEHCWGNELDPLAFKVSQYLYPSANLTLGDMRAYEPYVRFDYCIGNPPFNIKLKYEGEYSSSQMIYIKKCYELLNHGGILAIIVPKTFLEDSFANNSNIEYINSNFGFIGQIELKYDSFKNLGVTNFRTKILLLHKRSNYIESKEFNNVYIDKGVAAVDIFSQYILPIKNKIKANYSKIYLENIRNKSSKRDAEFHFKVKKMLFDINHSSYTKDKYIDCYELYQQYCNQTKPCTVSNDDWEKMKVKEKDVVSRLKWVLKNQYKKEKDLVRLVKSGNKLKVKGYSQHSNKLIEDIPVKERYLYEEIISGYSFKDNDYRKLVDKKRNEYISQSIDFNDMKSNIDIQEWLDTFSITDKYTKNVISLNSAQKEITNKMLQKRKGYIQASMGSGKTIMAIAYSLYKQDYGFSRNTLVIAPSIAINGTWVETLKSYGLKYIQIKKISDIKKIKPNSFVLVTFKILDKVKKQLKKYLKSISNKFTLVLDEAQCISNIYSQAFKATYNVGFGAKNKLLLSGTMTKNNITESFTQFLLLYGSTVDFLSKNKYIYKEDKEHKKVIQAKNAYYMKPFPAYIKGFKLFKASFNPEKITVFGANKNTQDIFNEESLKELINKTIITKKFEEIVGKKIYSVEHHLVSFNENESSLYYRAINRFYSMKYLFTSTGNPKKDKMMEIVQQLNTLLNICCNPQSYKEYTYQDTPSKYLKVMELVRSYQYEYVAIGCRTLKEVRNYEKELKKEFPDRALYIITGSTNMARRHDIIKKLRESSNGILLSTQQSLSSSISIEFVDNVIITALSWNWASLSQYFFRFIRYNSTREKTINIVSYENSLESNLLALIRSKEVLTGFMKCEETLPDDVDNELGIDFNLIDMLLTTEKDSVGNRYIKWGNQKIS